MVQMGSIRCTWSIGRHSRNLRIKKDWAQKMKEMNLAVLAKLGWRLLNDLKTLYEHKQFTLDKMVKKPSSSATWRGITTVANVLKQGIKISI